jgi:hypothetical protein
MKALSLTLCGLAAIGVSSAQETSHFAFTVSGGFTTPVGNTGRYVDDGWNVGGGVGYNFNSWVGALVDLNYNSMGINSTTLQGVGAPGGGLHVFSATLDPIVHLTPKSHFDLYVTGGGGMYRRQQDFTQPTAVVVPGFNPFFGFYPTAAAGSQVLSSYSSIKPGIDAGVGIAFGSVWHGKFFAEARYNRIIDAYHTDYVPVTFGFRW